MIYELAETIPDQFGFSIDFSGVTEVIGDEKFARCQELQSIDLSDAPAAKQTPAPYPGPSAIHVVVSTASRQR